MSSDNDFNSSNDDFEIGDVESFSAKKDQSFSHANLVMIAMRKILELGAKEMRNGWVNEKADRQGNIMKTYVEDTRRALIEGIKTCMMVMVCDYDELAREKIEELQKKLEDKRKELILKCDTSWGLMYPKDRNEYLRNKQVHYPGCLDIENYKKEYIEFEVDVYREIFAELSNLTLRVDEYKGEIFEA